MKKEINIIIRLFLTAGILSALELTTFGSLLNGWCVVMALTCWSFGFLLSIKHLIINNHGRTHKLRITRERK